MNEIEGYCGGDCEYWDVTACGLVMRTAVSEGRVINDILVMGEMESSETSLHLYRITQRHIP